MSLNSEGVKLLQLIKDIYKMCRSYAYVRQLRDMCPASRPKESRISCKLHIIMKLIIFDVLM